jgi:hypothetical protein
MKLTLAILILLLCCSREVPSIGNSNYTGGNNGSGPGGGGASADLISEDFEGAGAPSGWSTDTGTPDYDCTASPCPLVGSQSLSLGTADAAVFKGSLGSKSEVWFYFQFRFVSSVQNSTLLMDLRDSADNPAFQMDMTINFMRVNDGGVNASCVDGLSADTTYHCWGHYLKGSGANDTAEIKFSTTGIRPADGSNAHAKLTTGSLNRTIDRFYFRKQFSDAPVAVKFDKLRMSSVGDLGDNPS